MWSIGCILAELIRRKPLFPGKSHAHQVTLVFEVMGYNTPHDLGFPVTSEALSFLDKRCKFRKQPLSKVVPDCSAEAMELLEALLTVNPDARPSATEALTYPFLSDAEILHNYNVQYLTRPSPSYFDFEHEKYTVPQLKDMIDNEVYTASASAYRASHLPNPSSSTRSESKDGGHLQRGAQHTSAYNLTDSHSESDGPVSQLATQVKNVKVQHQQHHVMATRDHQSNNPFRNSNQPPASGAGGGGE
ncbi:hypothetical protein EON65_25300, partial [archaeon]